jgi:hypothetical protein
MKTVTALAAITIALACSLAGQARAAPSPEQRIAALERRVANIGALQKRATALEKRVKKLEAQAKEVNGAILAFALITVVSLQYTQCLTAVTADAFTGTWNVVDQIAQATQAGKVYFGPQPAVADSDACKELEIVRQQTVPPSVSPFSALTALITQ